MGYLIMSVAPLTIKFTKSCSKLFLHSGIHIRVRRGFKEGFEYLEEYVRISAPSKQLNPGPLLYETAKVITDRIADPITEFCDP